MEPLAAPVGITAALGDMVLAHFDLATASTLERKQKGALVWPQGKAAANALKRDCAATEQHHTSPLNTPFLPNTTDTFKVSTTANHHA
jgi:hypothetical protein